MTTTLTPPQTAEHRPNAFVRLYRGETSFDFVGRRRIWYTISAIIIVAGLVSLGTRGFNLGIDFKGGSSWQVPANGLTVTDVSKAMIAAGVPQPVVEELGTGSNTQIQVQADLSKLSSSAHSALVTKVQADLANLAHTKLGKVAVTDVGPTWGSQITKKAVIAVIVFFIIVVLYISFRFEWKMALAAFIAVIHDLLITAGIYSLFGFQVTPDTVIAVLTILGYSLYDTVVVFDRIRDSTKGLGASGRMTYADVVNLSMNQVLARSINTSLVAILPVLSVLVIGAEILGATTLQYFGLALVIGLTSGAYSSIFIASPILAQLKEREKRYTDLRQKLANRDTRAGLLTPAAAAKMMAGPETRRSTRPVKKQGGTIRPAARTAAAARATQVASRAPARTAAAARTGPAGAARTGAAGAARTGAARTGTSPSAGNGAADLDQDGIVDENEIAGNGGLPGSPVGKAAGGTGVRTGANAARRPPQRPRKGKGKSGGKGGRRR
jgi:preprotein translocase subunit SecF